MYSRDRDPFNRIMMQEPGIKDNEEAENRSRRTAAAQNHSRRQGADRRLLAGGGWSLQVAPRYGGGRRGGGHGFEESIPDAPGAGLRCRDQDAVDDRMAGASLESFLVRLNQAAAPV